jgi:hypothetical protein
MASITWCCRCRHLDGIQHVQSRAQTESCDRIGDCMDAATPGRLMESPLAGAMVPGTLPDSNSHNTRMALSYRLQLRNHRIALPSVRSECALDEGRGALPDRRVADTCLAGCLRYAPRAHDMPIPLHLTRRRPSCGTIVPFRLSKDCERSRSVQVHAT